jgi:hypothetical protein
MAKVKTECGELPPTAKLFSDCEKRSKEKLKAVRIHFLWRRIKPEIKERTVRTYSALFKTIKLGCEAIVGNVHERKKEREGKGGKKKPTLFTSLALNRCFAVRKTTAALSFDLFLFP